MFVSREPESPDSPLPRGRFPLSLAGSAAMVGPMAEIEEFPEVRVEVTDVVFMPTLESPPDKPFPFVYFITVRNDSPYPVTIRARKWVVRQHDGETIVVEGDGVVGQTPRLQPGEAFSYNSYHTIGANSEASGALFGEREDGSMFFTRIPAFRMDIPGPV